MKPVHNDHARLDERSIALHALVAEKLLADPSLMSVAKENLRRWQKANGSPSLALIEWEQILSGQIDQVAQFLSERTEKAVRLRQSSPFAGILSEAERGAIYESFTTRTYYPRSK